MDLTFNNMLHVQKTTQKTTQKITQKILDLIMDEPQITRKSLYENTGPSEDEIFYCYHCYYCYSNRPSGRVAACDCR